MFFAVLIFESIRFFSNYYRKDKRLEAHFEKLN